MYCGQCGKKVKDTMLFCPFCGAPIVIPEQDDGKQTETEVLSAEAFEETRQPEPTAQPKQPEPLAQPKPSQSLFDAADEKSQPAEEPVREEFVPLSFDLFQDESEAERETPDLHSVDDEIIMDVPPPPLPKRSVLSTVRREDAPRSRAKQTYIPVKEIDPNDMFMDGEADADEYEDEYDYDDRRHYSYGEDDFDFEERERGSFFRRHIRGIVGLILLGIILIVMGVWAALPNGQRVLAKMDLAWKAQPYAELGHQSYRGDQKLQAARYFEKAFDRDSTNYEYAHSAMVAYHDADEIDKAAAMLKKCIELQPNNSQPYHEMMILYPIAEQRPWEIRELIRLGYQRTGDASLNQ